MGRRLRIGRWHGRQGAPLAGIFCDAALLVFQSRMQRMSHENLSKPDAFSFACWLGKRFGNVVERMDRNDRPGRDHKGKGHDGPRKGDRRG